MTPFPSTRADVSMSTAYTSSLQSPAGPIISSLPMTLLTWNEYAALTGTTGANDAHLDDSFDELSDDSDSDDDLDDQTVSYSLFMAASTPAFAVTNYGDYSGPNSSPSVPSTTLENAINKPTFALVPSAAIHNAQRSAIARHPFDHIPRAVPVCPPVTTPVLKPAPSLVRKPRSPPKTQTHHQIKRCSKAKTTDELNKAARALSITKKRVSRTPSTKNNKFQQQQRNPLQPKVPNAPTADEIRNVAAL